MQSENVRRIKKVRVIFEYALICLVLFCIVFDLLPFSQRKTVESADLVFCPLQKAWVKRHKTEISTENPLSQICASDLQKNKFLLDRLSLSLLSFNRNETESLFFDYLRQGRSAFIKAYSSRNLPEQEQIEAIKEHKIAGYTHNGQKTKKLNTSFTLPQAPRPPSNQEQTLLWTIASTSLETVLKQIHSRAPPFLL